jgi:hypothetical protein
VEETGRNERQENKIEIEGRQAPPGRKEGTQKYNEYRLIYFSSAH